MESSQQQTFVVNRSGRSGLLIGLVLCFGMAAGACVLLYHLDKWTLLEVVPILGGAIFFVGVALLSLRVLMSTSKSSVGVDDDGLWLLHIGKERGLVPWDAIRDVRERGIQQRLDVLGDKKQVLIKLEYQLVGFEKLHPLVASRMLGENELGVYPAVFTKSWSEHLKALGIPMLLIAAGVGSVYFGHYALALFGLGGILLLVLYPFNTYRLLLHENHFEAKSILNSGSVQREDVVSVALTTRSAQGVTVSFALLKLKDGSEVRLSDLGCSTIRLLRALMVWKYLPDEVGIEQ